MSSWYGFKFLQRKFDYHAVNAIEALSFSVSVLQAFSIFNDSHVRDQHSAVFQFYVRWFQLLESRRVRKGAKHCLFIFLI